MDKLDAIAALAALAQPTRLDAFRLLVKRGADGVAAGEIARALSVPHNTLSTHLATLVRAGLIEARRESQSLIYTARLDGFRELAGFLLKDCCGGHPEVCAPLINDITPCCQPKEKSRGRSRV